MHYNEFLVKSYMHVTFVVEARHHILYESVTVSEFTFMLKHVVILVS